MSSMEPASGKTSPVKQEILEPAGPEKRVLKKKSGFFQNHSPFRRKSIKEAQAPAQNRNTWHVTRSPRGEVRTASPEPIDANASLALGVGQNVLPVTTPDTARRRAHSRETEPDQSDPIALALAELKEVSVGKQSSLRISADHYHGIATPAPGVDPRSARPGARDAPPSYNNQAPVSRLGVPPPAVTSRAMKEATKKAADQSRAVFGNTGNRGVSPASRPATRGSDMPRAASPAPARTASPQPRMNGNSRYRSASPNPYSGHHRNGSQVSISQQRGSDQSFYGASSPHGSTRSVRGASPAGYGGDHNRPRSSYGGSDMAVQLASVGDDRHSSYGGRGTVDIYDGGSRPRSKSVADPSRQYTRDGRPILHYARALYMYQAAIPEELGFAKGDYLAVLRHQDDGWWEAEVHGGNGRVGLVPSNYLQPC